jgi:HEPN domain-containing protein
MLTAVCPHCHIISSVQHLFELELRDRINSWVICQCHNCEMPIFGNINSGTPNKVRVIHPPVMDEEPEEYPEEVKENYKEAVRSLAGGNYKASVIMTRSALQAAMREMQATGKDLRAEIEDLAARHVIPTSIKDWAHNIRQGGNLVAHPRPNEKIGKEDAEELLGLAQSLFLYLYVVPGIVEARRQRLNPLNR